MSRNHISASIVAAVAALAIGAAIWWLVAGGTVAAGTRPAGGRDASDADEAADLAAGAPPARLAPVPVVVAKPFGGEVDGAAVGPWVIRGRVINEADAAVAKVLVRLVVQSEPEAPAATAAGASSTVTREVVTGADGGFAFGLTPPVSGRACQVQVVSDVCESEAVCRFVGAGGEPPEPLLMRALAFTGTLGGVVTDDMGRPLAGATVTWVEKMTTGSDGAYRFPTSARRNFAYLNASAPGFVAQTLHTALPAGGAATLNFALTPGATIDGVVRGDDGKPVPGALIRLLSNSADVRVTAGTDGVWQIDGIKLDTEPAFVQVGAAEFLTATAQAMFVNRRAQVDVTLRRGVVVAGMVVDRDGNPLAGTRVTIGDVRAAEFVSVMTDADGRFTAGNVPPVTATIAAAREGFATHEEVLAFAATDTRPANVRLVLAAPRRISGRVVDTANKPVECATVTPVPSTGPSWKALAATTDAAGRFSIAGLPGVGVRLSASRHGYSRAVTPREVDGDDVVLVLPGYGRLAGQVIDAVTGAPITKFRVKIGEPSDLPDSARQPKIWETSWAGAGRTVDAIDGTWETGDLGMSAGSVFDVAVDAEGYATGTFSRVVATTVSNPMANVIALRRGSTVSGVVVTTRGAPIARAPVWVTDSGQRHAATHGPAKTAPRDAETDDAGAFVLTNVSPGQLSIIIGARDLPACRAGPFAVPPGDRVTDVRVVVPDGGTVTGVVLDRAGRPVVGEHVEVAEETPIAADLPRATITGPDGRFAVRGLPAGRLRVGSARGPGTAQRVVKYVSLETNGSAEVVLAADGPCAIHLMIASDVPLPAEFDVTVTPQGAGQVGPQTGRTAHAHGSSITLSGLDAGGYQVHVLADLPTHRQGGAVFEAVTTFDGSAIVTLVPGAPTEARVVITRTRPDVDE